jgi:hypothetical protein
MWYLNSSILVLQRAVSDLLVRTIGKIVKIQEKAEKSELGYSDTS